MNSGIYIIVNPKGKVYVGSSFNVEGRISNYKKGWAGRRQPRLFNSFLKYGIDNHSFSIQELCEKHQTKDRERYWQEFYNAVGDNGLNCVLVESNGAPKIHTEITKKKISETLTGRVVGPPSDLTRSKISESHRRKWPTKEEIQELSHTVCSMQDLQNSLGISFPTLKLILEEYGIHKDILTFWKNHSDKNKLNLILAHYKEVVNVEELSNTIGIGTQTIRRVIKNNRLQKQIYEQMASNRTNKE
jgi:group I intron endonuclease